jgi:eukaryotic-like serine/threonine-protein kinase
MALVCPSCGAQNDDAADMCFTCGRGLHGLTQGTVIGSRYEILASLGKGGMGMVYKAHDRELDETVALKVLRGELAQSAEMAKRFRSEIKLARKVRHPNVCAIHEYGQDGSRQFIAMEYIEGSDLKQELRQRGGLPPHEAYDVAIQLAEGLQAVHSVGVIHRDLKTPNIMRDGRGVLRLMDFGIAKQYGAQTTAATATGQIVGTPEYMSPEQCRGEPIDSRSDLYALGVVIFEIFTGDVPFRGETPLATLFKHLQDPPPLEVPNRKTPPALVPILKKLLAKSREERYSSAREVADALRAARALLPPPSLPSTRRGAPTVALPRPMLPEPDTTPLPTPVPTAIPTHTTTPIAMASIAHPAPTPGATQASASRRWPSAAVWALATGLVALGAFGATMMLRPGASTDVASAPPATSSATAPQVTPPAVPPATNLSSPRPEPLARPLLVTPAARAQLAYPDPAHATTRFRWNAVPGATAYHFVLLSRPLVDERVTESSVELGGLPVGSYAWRVAGVDRDGRDGAFSEVFQFTVARSAEASRAVAPPASMPSTPAPVAEAPGILRLAIRPYAEVSIDGRIVGTTPMKPLTLTAGVHSIVLSNPGFHPLTRRVTIEAGKTASLEIDLTFEAFPK